MIEVRTTVNASRDVVWNLYTDAAETKEWNTASADWHTTDVKIALITRRWAILLSHGS